MIIKVYNNNAFRHETTSESILSEWADKEKAKKVVYELERFGMSVLSVKGTMDVIRFKVKT